MKTYKSIKIKKVTAYPLDENGNNKNRDLFIGITNGFKLPEIKEDYIIPNIRNAAKAIMGRDGLSWKYKKGEVAVFQVKYQLDSKSGTRTLTFLTRKDEE